MKSSIRNPKIEFARLMACMIVVMLHVSYLVSRVEEPAIINSYRACLLADPVAVFWMITGFFVFNSSDYEKKWRKVLKKIVVPTFLVYIIGYLMANYLYGNAEVGWLEGKSIRDFFVNYLSPLLHADHPVEAVVAHTWYVIAYFLVMLFLPIVKLFVEWIDKSMIREIVFLAISLGLMIVNDLTYNKVLHLGFEGIPVVVGSYIFIIWGHIIYKYLEKIKIRPLCFVFIFIYFAVDLIRAILLNRGKQELGEEVVCLTWWTTSFSVVVAVCFLGFAFSVIKNENSKFNRIINYISGFSFNIYLIHPFVLAVLYRTRLFGFLTNELTDNPIIATMSSLLIVFAIVFITSFIIAWILRFIFSSIIMLKNKIRICP